MQIPPVPERFGELCEKIGLALMLSQKVQFALAHYFAVYHIKKQGWSKTQAKKRIERHLSKPMGVVISDIEKQAPLDDLVAQKVRVFLTLRNWLAHDFDEEATPYLAQDQRFPEYIAKMDEIRDKAWELAQDLHAVGEALIPVAHLQLKG